MLAQKSLLKYFRRYADELLFISVATEVKSASIICQYLIGEEREMEESFESVVHDKTINSAKLKQFLTQNASKEKALEHPFVKENLPSVRAIAMLGKSMWDDAPLPCLLQLREEFLKKYSAFWSNGHQIERDVKEAEYCQNMKRSEEMASVYSISRSVLVPAVNEITKLRRKEIVGEELDPKKRNDNKSKFVSYTALTELDN